MDEQNQGVQLIGQDQSDEQKRKAAQGAALTSMGSGAVAQAKSAPSMTGGTGPSTSGMARAQQAAGGAKGSGFTGIGRYLGANVGSRLGQTISGGISAVGQQAKSRLGEAVGKFKGQLSTSQQQLGQAQTGFQQEYSGILAGTAPSVQAQVPGVAQTPMGVGGIAGATRAYTPPPPPSTIPAAEGVQPQPAAKPGLEQPIVSPIKGPAETTLSETKPPEAVSTEAPKPAAPTDAAAAYRALTQGQILTPKGLEDTEAAQQRAARAAQMAEATRTAGGRAALLQEQFGRGGRLYTRGQTALDALLLGKASKELAGARKEATGVQRQLRSEEKTAEEQAKEFQSRTKAAAEEAKSAVGGAEQKLGTEIRGQKEQYEKELNRLSTNLTQEIESGELSQESASILKNLGLDPTSAQLYNLDKKQLSGMIRSRGLADVSEATSASLQQLQKINALKRLTGQEPTFTAEQLAQAGQTVGKEAAITGLGTEGELSEKLKQGRQEYEKLLGQIIPGYKGFGEVVPEAQEFKTQADLMAALQPGRREGLVTIRPEQDRDQAQRQITGLETQLKQLEASAAKADPKQSAGYQQQIDLLKGQLEQNRQKLAEAESSIAKRERAQSYLGKLGAFEYSPGEGNLARNVELASRIYGGGLFDPTTGELNTQLAQEAAGFFGWRPQYLGQEGLFGAGRYGRYEGDVARQQALQQLIAGAGQRFKIKGQ